MEESRPMKAIGFWVLMASLVTSFAGLTYPLYVIRPFRHQGARELAVALWVFQTRPLVEVVCIVLAVGGLALYWRDQLRRSLRILAAVGALAVGAFAALSQVNVYELMFHPDTHPLFASAQQAKVDPDDKVLAVKLGGSARAYPIRAMGYHHIINDVVGQVPIVATY